MKGFLLAAKSETKQYFDENGIRFPVTTLISPTCYLIGIKTNADDGYASVKLAFGEAKSIKKPVLGELKKVGVETPLRHLKEFRLVKDTYEIIEQDGKKGIKIGDVEIFVGMKISPDLLFSKGDSVDVTGTSKGKGFQGVVKRHNFRGGPKTHGQSNRHRAPGSMGSGTTPGRVYKGKKLGGRMGADTITIKNLEIFHATETELLVKGLVPGTKKGIIEIKKK